MSESRFIVSGMHCAACAARIERIARRQPSVQSAVVSLLAKELRIIHTAPLNTDTLCQAIQEAGFFCAPLSSASIRKADELKEQWHRLLPTGILWFLLFIMMLCHNLMHRPPFGTLPIFGSFQLTVTLLIFLINRKVFFNGFKNLFSTPDMDSQVAVGCTSAFILSSFSLFQPLQNSGFFFESAAMILFIVSVGKYLEAKAQKHAGSALDNLHSLVSRQVTLIKDGKNETRNLEEIRTGDIIQIAAGEHIPLDGTILFGDSALDTSAITGESIPRDATPGDQVYAGYLNQSGTIQIRVSAVNGATLLDEIIRAVSSAGYEKNRWVRLADRLAAIFVPVVLILSLATYVIWTLLTRSVLPGLNRAISVLVVSCPCALGLATPLAVTCSYLKALRKGILFKNPETLEMLPELDTLFLDKTGTLTTGHPILVAQYPDSPGALAIAAALESQSTHPLGKAIVQAAQKQELSLPPIQSSHTTPGNGMSAVIQNKSCRIGSWKYLGTPDLTSEEQKFCHLYRQQGATIVMLQVEQKRLALFAIRDTIAPHCKEALQELHSHKIRTVMLTGDSPEAARTIAEESGVMQFQANLLPHEKTEAIRHAQQQNLVTAMAGDGINDAPALATADIGFALHSGTDLAMDSADIVLMKSDLHLIPQAIQIARITRKTIRQNLFWALLYNVCAIPIAAGILIPMGGPTLSPMLAAIYMSSSSLFVVCNSLRKHHAA